MCDEGNLKLVLCDNREEWGGEGDGKEVQGEGDTSMPVTDAY